MTQAISANGLAFIYANRLIDSLDSSDYAELDAQERFVCPC